MVVELVPLYAITILPVAPFGFRVTAYLFGLHAGYNVAAAFVEY